MGDSVIHPGAIPIRCLETIGDRDIQGLSDVLIDCVEGGASVSFMHPMSRAKAEAFWRRVAQGVAAGERALLVAEDVQGVCGTVQLVFDWCSTYPRTNRTGPMWRRCWCIAGRAAKGWRPR